MRRSLQCLNLCGVILLTVLCVFQWRKDRNLNLDLIRAEKTRLDQAAQLAQEENELKGVKEDLAQLKESLTLEQQTRAKAANDLKNSERTNHQLTLERDQLKTSVTDWAAAVRARDERLKEANVHINQLAADLNVSILKFNELATNYNASIHKYDELATNYNAVVKDLNELRARSAPAPKP